MATALFTQVNGDPTTTSGTFVDIPQLSFTLPAASADADSALVTLNVPMPYAIGGTDNGISYRLLVDNRQNGTGAATHSPSENGRSPFNLVSMVALTSDTQVVKAQWQAERGGTAHLGGSASISAVLVQI